MGGKRELRRCMSSMLDDRTQAAEDVRSHVTNFVDNHVTNGCPVTIQIEDCGEDENRDENRNDGKVDNVNGSDKQKGQKHKRAGESTTDNPRLNSLGLSVKLSPTLPRKTSPNFLDIPSKHDFGDTYDLSHVKATAIRLKLQTRRSSFLEWQAACARTPPKLPPNDDVKDRLTSERKERINDALDWLKTELTEMKSMDQHLARQLLSLRHDIHQLRLRRSCQEHRDLLDDVQSELEEQEELSDVLDLPTTTLNDTPLKQIGVTRMNISARRFSTC